MDEWMDDPRQDRVGWGDWKLGKWGEELTYRLICTGSEGGGERMMEEER